MNIYLEFGIPKGKDAIGIEDAPLDGKDYVRRNGEWIDVASGGNGGIKTLSSDEISPMLPTGIYKYDDGETMSIIIVKHTDYDNYQAKIDADGRIYCRVNPFLYGEWQTDTWRAATIDEADFAWEALTAEKAECDMDGKFIHLTYATKDEVGNIETALDNIIAIQNSLIGGDSV